MPSEQSEGELWVQAARQDMAARSAWRDSHALASAWQRLAWANAYTHRTPPIANTVYQNLPEDLWSMITEVLVSSVPWKTVAARLLTELARKPRANQ
jgi:cephalosporin hydroxylase